MAVQQDRNRKIDDIQLSVIKKFGSEKECVASIVVPYPQYERTPSIESRYHPNTTTTTVFYPPLPPPPSLLAHPVLDAVALSLFAASDSNNCLLFGCLLLSPRDSSDILQQTRDTIINHLKSSKESLKLKLLIEKDDFLIQYRRSIIIIIQSNIIKIDPEPAFINYLIHYHRHRQQQQHHDDDDDEFQQFQSSL